MKHPTVESTGFIPLAPVTYESKASGERESIPAESIVAVLANTNKYLYSLAAFFEDADFEFYEAVGQRNLSGFIGEVFVKSFEKLVDGYACNPHADGRPDILDLTTDQARAYFEEECFTQGDRGPVPVRGKLAPFKYGGLEVKASIGNPVAKYKAKLMERLGVGSFMVGMPRVDYLSSITYWGHHASCENLIGLYYDYVPELDESPQIFMAMQAELDVTLDWHEVSVGRASSKKTSNTSLTKTGRAKLYSNVVAAPSDPRYLEQLQKIGVEVSAALTR